MASVKEEGELSDGEIDEEVERGTAEMGERDNLPEPAVPRPHSAPATAPTIHQHREPSVHQYRESRENVANNSDFDSEDSNSDSDSDSANRSWKRQRTMPGMSQDRSAQQKRPPSAATSRMQTEHTGKREPRMTEQRSSRQPDHRAASDTKAKKRRNNIWGEVMTEQTAERVEKQITEFDMDTETDRDVESYNYRLALEEAPRHKLGMSVERTEMADEDSKRDLQTGLGEDETDKWLVDKTEEQRGSVKERLGYKNVKGRLGDRLGLDAEIEDLKEQEKEETEKRKRREHKFGKRKGAKQRLGQRSGGHSDQPTMKSVTFSDGEHPKEVAGKIAFSLNEEKRHLTMRVVDTLGVDKSKELWQLTLDVEESGGMMIMNGSRRRTPGGVFLHLMKTDEDVTKQQVNEIFAEEKKKERKQEKEFRRRKRKHVNFEKYLEETKAIMEEKRDEESHMEEADLDQDVEGDIQLDFMDGAGDVDKDANDSKVTDKSENMESEGMTV